MTAPTPVPDLRGRKLVLVGGFPGSGKTEVARMLAGVLDGTHFDKDALTRQATEAALISSGQPRWDRESDYYRTQIRPQEYATLLRTGVERFQWHHTVVLDAPFLAEAADENWLAWLRDTAAGLQARVVLVWIHADLPTMRQRIIDRRAERDTWKLANWEQWSQSVTVYTGPIRHVIPVYDIDNRREAEPYLGNQLAAIGHQIVNGIAPAPPAGDTEPQKRRRWRR